MTADVEGRATGVLRARGVVKTLGGVRVLRGVDATFEAGVVHVVEGGNGAGKSTLLALLAGRMRPTAGTVVFEDGDEERARRGAALVSQVAWLGHELGLYLDLTARENVALHARLRGRDDAWGRWSETLHVAQLGDRRVRELSRGQRQRVALLRALAADPRVLLLDEPSTGLDAASVDRLAALLRRLVGEGRIVVTTTHDNGFRERLQPRRWQLREGKLRGVDVTDG